MHRSYYLINIHAYENRKISYRHKLSIKKWCKLSSSFFFSGVFNFSDWFKALVSVPGVEIRASSDFSISLSLFCFDTIPKDKRRSNRFRAISHTRTDKELSPNVTEWTAWRGRKKKIIKFLALKNITFYAYILFTTERNIVNY